MARYLVGLTGGLASGKSTVAGWLREAGFLVVDADRVVAELYVPGGRGAAAVRELFGAEYLTVEGAVDRPALARRVFADDEALRRLEEAVHPLVRERFAEIARAADEVVVYEATLLVESGHCEHFDLAVTVEADEEHRLRWAIARGMDKASARSRLAAQGDGSQRRAGSDLVLDNDGTLDELRCRVDELVTRLRAQARVPERKEEPEPCRSS